MAPSFASRLMERKLVQWSVAYLAAAWLLLQVASLVGAHFGWPATTLRIFTVVLVVGLFVTLVLAWYHGERGKQHVSGPELLMLTGILAIAGVAVAWARGTGSAASPPESGDPVERTAAAERAPGSIAARGRSVAVLPFVLISADPGNDYFADGMTQELISTLARVPGLRVAARSSVFALEGKNLDVRAVGDTLGVAYVLEGSVRSAGSSLRVTAQLVGTEDGYHLWSAEFDRELEDVFRVQDEIARSIADALSIELADGGARPLLARPPTEDLEAHDLYLKGRHFLRTRGRDGLSLAVRHLEEAIARDPTYARAYAGLAQAHTRLGQLGYASGAEQARLAKAAALRALELDSTLAEAHTSLAHILFAREWDWKGAEERFQRALSLDPYDTMALYLYGIFLLGQGRVDEAGERFLLAYELDPLFPSTSHLLGRFYLETGRPDLAVRFLRESLELAPSQDLAHQLLGHAYLRTSLPTEAIASFRRAAELSGARDSAHLAYGYAVTGRRQEAEVVLRRLLEEPRARPLPAVDLAVAYAGLGDHDEAFRWLERGFAEHAPFMDHLRMMPGLDPLRSDPRFVALLGRLGLPATL